MTARETVLRDEGSASVALVGVVSAVTILAVAVIGSGATVATRSRAAGAADAAALAAADALVGVVAGDPCARARSTSAANGVAVVTCRIDGATVTVEVATRVGGVEVRGRATAGPASTRGPLP